MSTSPSPVSGGTSGLPSLRQQLVSFTVAVLVLIPLAVLYREFLGDRNPPSSVSIRRINYEGWTNALSMVNEQAEVVVVPSIGRIMQFRFLGESGPFWENPALRGKSPDPLAAEWVNFGGDKVWPAPQSEWAQWTPRAWPPPPGFDSESVEVEVVGDRVLLKSAVDAHYGIRWEREIRLDPLQARMIVVTRYHKVSETSLTNLVAIWSITQLREAVAVLVPRLKPGHFGNGYELQSELPPPDLQVDDDWIRLTRNPKASHKIGNDAGTLIWLGERVALRVDSPRRPEGLYPDRGCSAEVYTNPDPLAYVELELLSPLEPLRPGQTMAQTNTYTLFLRQEKDSVAEARRILSR